VTSPLPRVLAFLRRVLEILWDIVPAADPPPRVIYD
jgi:hypothetical protein